MKLLLLIFSFLFMFDVNANTCFYEIDGETYSVNYELDLRESDWRKAYKYDNGDYGNLYNESGSQATNLKIVNASKRNIFNSFIKFGSKDDGGTCPVLVFIGSVDGNSEYTFIPYGVYTNFFALDVTLDCPDCNENKIMAIDYSGNNIIYEFDSFCKALTASRIYVSDFYITSHRNERVPLIGYFYYNNKYENLSNLCKDYLKNGNGMTSNKKLRNFLEPYENSFFISTDSIEEWMEACPLVNSNDSTADIKKCLKEKRNILVDAAKQFQNVCTENEMRAIQSYASGTTSKFYDKHNVSGYLNNEIKLLFSSFSSECGSAADNLYRNINNAGRIVNTYRGRSLLNNTLIFLNFESEYLNAFSLLTNINPNVKIVDDTCKLISDGLRKIIKEILNAFRVGACILVILLSVVEVYKAIISGDDGARKKMVPLIGKRLAALVVILILPTLMMILLDFLNRYIPVDSSRCVISDIVE